MARQPIEVFFATNRNLIGTEAKPKFGEGFHTLGPYYIRYGRGMVAPPAEDSGEYKVKSVKLAKEKIPKRRGAAPTLGSDEIFESVRSQMSAGDMDTVILIHGFASTFNTALKRAAEIKQKYRYDDRELNAFVFSWPANGEMVPYVSYYSDRNDAQASGVAMARSFLRLREFLENLGREKFCRQSLHLVAHSMGNYALRHAIQAIRVAQSRGSYRRLADALVVSAITDIGGERNGFWSHGFVWEMAVLGSEVSQISVSDRQRFGLGGERFLGFGLDLGCRGFGCWVERCDHYAT